MTTSTTGGGPLHHELTGDRPDVVQWAEEPAAVHLARRGLLEPGFRASRYREERATSAAAAVETTRRIGDGAPAMGRSA